MKGPQQGFFLGLQAFGGENKVEMTHTQGVVHEALWINSCNSRVAGCKGEARILGVAFGVARIIALTCGERDDECVVEELTRHVST